MEELTFAASPPSEMLLKALADNNSDTLNHIKVGELVAALVWEIEHPTTDGSILRRRVLLERIAGSISTILCRQASDDQEPDIKRARLNDYSSLVSPNEQESEMLAKEIYYEERKNLIKAINTLLKVVVVNQGPEVVLVADFQEYMEDLIAGGIQQTLISLIKEFKEDPTLMFGSNFELSGLILCHSLVAALILGPDNNINIWVPNVMESLSLIHPADHPNYKILEVFLSILHAIVHSERQALKVFNLLEQRPFAENYGWLAMFDCFMHYETRYEDSLDHEGEVATEMQIEHSRALVEYLRLHQKLSENGITYKRFEWYQLGLLTRFRNLPPFLEDMMRTTMYLFLEREPLPVMRGKKPASSSQASRFRNVVYDKCGMKWKATVTEDGKRKNLGSYIDEVDAARRVDNWAIEQKSNTVVDLNLPESVEAARARKRFPLYTLYKGTRSEQ